MQTIVITTDHCGTANPRTHTTDGLQVIQVARLPLPQGYNLAMEVRLEWVYVQPGPCTETHDAATTYPSLGTMPSLLPCKYSEMYVYALNLVLRLSEIMPRAPSAPCLGCYAVEWVTNCSDVLLQHPSSSVMLCQDVVPHQVVCRISSSKHNMAGPKQSGSRSYAWPVPYTSGEYQAMVPDAQYLEGPYEDATIDPGIAVGPGSAHGTYTLYALLAPVGPVAAAGYFTIVGEYLYNAAKRTFKYRNRYTATSRHTVST